MAEFLPVQEHLKKQNVRFGRDFTSKCNQKPYVNVGSFLDNIRTIFLSYLDTLRGLAVFAEEVAVLLMDNCSAHVSNDVIHILTEAKVRVITFAPRTTKVFQLLDLTLFGVLKLDPRYGLPFDDAKATVKCMMKVYRNFRHTIVPFNVWGAFRAFGLEFEFDTRREPYRLLFDEEKLRGSAGFEELCWE
jgi:hypothetical protein